MCRPVAGVRQRWPSIRIKVPQQSGPVNGNCIREYVRLAPQLRALGIARYGRAHYPGSRETARGSQRNRGRQYAAGIGRLGPVSAAPRFVPEAHSSKFPCGHCCTAPAALDFDALRGSDSSRALVRAARPSSGQPRALSRPTPPSHSEIRAENRPFRTAERNRSPETRGTAPFAGRSDE